MRVTGLKVGIFVSAVVALVSFSEYSLLNAAHASTTGTAHVESPVASAPVIVEAPEPVSKPASQVAATASDCESYVQVFDEIGEDPEHAQARMVTPSYAIN